VVPTLENGFTIGKRIMIAWDRSPLATRAVHNSRPFMRNADSVHILAINLEPESRGGVPGSGICEHLARHDIEATPVHVTSKTDSVADVILSQAKELETDLIIMGAYGHSWLRERILGGNTYHLLNNSPIPMLMSH
jgi:nucleotide-binding universal stress UspA family protein